jgi:hypothetical protein
MLGRCAPSPTDSTTDQSLKVLDSWIILPLGPHQSAPSSVLSVPPQHIGIFWISSTPHGTWGTLRVTLSSGSGYSRKKRYMSTYFFHLILSFLLPIFNRDRGHLHFPCM